MQSATTNTDLFRGVDKEIKPYRLFLLKFHHDWSVVLSSMLAFNFLLALLPMAMVFFGILALVLGHNLPLQNRVKASIVNAFPPKANEGLREIINVAFDKLYHDAAIILSFGIFFAVLGCLRLFVAIDRALTIIYRLEERKFWKKYLLAVKMLALFLSLLPLMLVASSMPSVLLGVIPNVAGRLGTYVLGLVTSLALTFLLFEVIYVFTPNRKMTFQQTWRGAILAAGGMQLIMILFPLYVRKCMTSYTGQVGFAIILMLFLFFFAIALVLGAQFNAFFYEHIPPLPAPLGTFVSECVQTPNQSTHGS